MKANTAELSKILLLRADQSVWDRHPIIMAGAILPTGPTSAAIPLVMEQARMQRGCIAFWAHPTTGKTCCITALIAILTERFPGCGIVRHEAKSNSKVVAEGSFIADMLHSLEYCGKIQHTVADKREQLRRALYAHGAASRHIIFLLDEAQELAEPEFRWLKEVGNWLVQRGFKVTTVLFGQEELIELRDYVRLSGRSDLGVRFFQNMYEFEQVQCYQDLVPLLEGCDEGSEYPEGTGWSYTHFLWPEAYAAGFRLKRQASRFWQAFASVSLLTKGEHGVSMSFVAESLSHFADATRDRDATHMQPTDKDWVAAVERTGYEQRALPSPMQGRTLPKIQHASEES